LRRPCRHAQYAYLDWSAKEDDAMRLAAIAVFALMLAVPANAHHGWGSYDAENPVTLEGPIDAVTFDFPHTSLTVSSDNVVWLVTLAPPSRMKTRGATAEIVQTGKTVKAHGYPKRDGTKEIRAEWIEVDGQHYELR
jgi:hypothetical protein